MALEFGDLIIALASTLISIILSYIFWGRKANKLNNLLIEEMNNSKENLLKAELFAKIKKSSADNNDLSYYYLEITNIGKSSAQNVELIYLDESIEFSNTEKFPINLEPEQVTLVNIIKHDYIINFELKWDDKFSENRIKTYALPRI